VSKLYKTGEEKRPPSDEQLILLFRVDRKEGREALDAFRSAFGVAADLEAVTECLMALLISPGHPGRSSDDRSRGGGAA